MVERASFEKLTGVVLGSYRLEKLIEQNKWGPVFLASSQTGTSFVVRFVDASFQNERSGQAADAQDIVFLGRFQQEANRIAALQHPHILPLLDYGNYQGAPYLVYPNVSLPSLRSLLAQSVPTDLALVGRYLDQIAGALEHAHQHAVIHRNLSTSCIFMQANGQMVVTEFGLLRIHELGRQESQPANGNSFEGSSESSAPEQLLGKPVDAYTDIYALGAVLYRLLTGHPPFAGKTREEVTQQHLYSEVPSLQTWRSSLPGDLDHIITKAMSKEPMQRYRQPLAFAQAYHRVVAPNEPHALLAAPPPVALPPVPQPPAALSEKSAPRMSRRTLFPLLVGGAIVAGGAVLASAKIFSGGSTAPTTSAAGSSTPVTTAKGATSGGKVIGRTSAIAANSATTFPIANQANPGVLVHLRDNRFVAFDSTCTHAGCAVAYDPQNSLLHCPCHDALFDPAKGAAVVRGPAQTPLASIKISVQSDGTITT